MGISNNKFHKDIKFRQSLKVITQIMIAFLFIYFIWSYFTTYHARYLDKFSENLFKYPIPPETVLLEKEKYDGKNWVHGGGSGGYWNVVAVMKFSTKLSKQAVIDYYKDARFPYSKSNKPNMLEPEIYFENDAKRIVRKEGAYYMSKNGTIKPISSYTSTKYTNERSDDLVYILQIIGGYDYFFRLD